MGFDRSVLNVIEQLNQTVLQPETWPVALANAVSLLGGDHAILFTNRESAAAIPFGVYAGLSEQDIERFASPVAKRLCQPMEQLLIPGTVTSSADCFSDPEFERSEFYNEIIRPANGFYSLSFQEERPDLAFHFSICRPRGLGTFTTDEAHELEILLPHMTVALQLRQRLQISEYRSRGLAEALSGLDEGAIILDRSNRPLIVNARAARILEQGDGLSFASGRLRASTDALTDKLCDAIAVAGASTTKEGQRLHLPRLAPRLPLLLNVIPVWRLQAHESGLGAPSVLIFIREPDIRPDIDRTALEDIFRLTPRESEIAALLADGASAGVIATKLDLTVGTVRFNLKRVFRKTGTHSQTALVALARSFSR